MAPPLPHDETSVTQILKEKTKDTSVTQSITADTTLPGDKEERIGT